MVDIGLSQTSIMFYAKIFVAICNIFSSQALEILKNLTFVVWLRNLCLTYFGPATY